ncbi:inositol monophosphatase family protein [Actinosynnema sp. NPDC059797]
MRETDGELAIRAAEAGAAVVRAMYGGRLERFAKSGDDFATEADVAAERAVMAVLREARPADGFLGEESGDLGEGASGRRWLVDPLCGTLNYAARTPLVAVNVALRADDRVTAAAAADPLAHEVFWTGGEAAHVRSEGRDVPLRPDPTNHLVDLNLDPPFPNRDWFLAADLLTDEGFTSAFRPRVLSTTLALAWVAAGRRAAYVTDGHLRDSVHFSSGIALCQAAGCVVTNLAGQPVHTGAQGLIAAADATIHATLLDLVSHRRQPRTSGRA